MGRSANQPKQAAGGAQQMPAVMPPSSSFLSTPKTLPPEANTTVGPAVMPQQPQMVQPTGPNIFQQSSGALSQAQQTLGNLAQFQPQAMQTAQLGPASQMQAAQIGPAAQMQGVGQTNVGQLGTTDIGKYMSPYTQQVIERGQADIDRQREQAMNRLGAQATAAGAFGGSRHGWAEGVTMGEYGRMAGDFATQQREKAYQQALGAAQYDIGLRNQAAEAAAAREQAARSGNVAAANQFALQQAQLEQQAAQFNPQAANQLAMQQAQLQQQANQATFGGQFQGAGVRHGAASGLASLGGQMFGIGQQVQSAIGQQGQFQRGLQQQLLDRAMGQYGGATGAPLAGLGALSSIISGVPYGQTQTASQGFNPASLLMLL